MTGEIFGHPLDRKVAPRRAHGRESWVAALARRAVLPVPVVERVLAAMLDLGGDPAAPPGGFEPAIAAAVAAHQRQLDDHALLLRAADAARAGGQAGDADDFRGGE